MFLVVIIESFADLRSTSEDEQSKHKKDTFLPLGFLAEEQRLKFQKKRQLREKFILNFDKYYFRSTEKIFILFVAADAIITATKHTNMDGTWAKVLIWWQVSKCINLIPTNWLTFFFHFAAVCQCALCV